MGLSHARQGSIRESIEPRECIVMGSGLLSASRATRSWGIVQQLRVAATNGEEVEVSRCAHSVDIRSSNSSSSLCSSTKIYQRGRQKQRLPSLILHHAPHPPPDPWPSSPRPRQPPPGNRGAII
ncbi:hypothetical protein SEVIR_9G303532v4 [Setaria viridis]